MPTQKTISSLLAQSKPTLSFEFFPPKDAEGRRILTETFETLLVREPNFVSVTYGAMGSNQETSIAVVKTFAKVVPTIAHLTCIGSSRSSIQSLLAEYEASGVAGLLALRGDVPPAFEGKPLGDFEYASDLVELASKESDLEIGVAAFPEKHPESVSLDDDLKVLKLKADRGADFAMTQLFFNVDAYFDLVTRAKSHGFDAPIVPGLMPISNVKQVLRMAQMSGATIPKQLLASLEAATSDSEARTIGMDFTVGLANKLISGGAPGLHLFTLNQSTAVLEVLDRIDLA